MACRHGTNSVDGDCVNCENEQEDIGRLALEIVNGLLYEEVKNPIGFVTAKINKHQRKLLENYDY